MRAEVIDSFDVKGRVAVEYGAPGAVVIFTPFDDRDPPITGERLLVVRPDGWMRAAVIGEVKLGSGAPGFFVPGVTMHDLPVGTQLHWGADLTPSLINVGRLATVG